MNSSPLRSGATIEEELEYYKREYSQLETDLADFQPSSKELEEQLERDIETAEKSERKLKEQLEKLSFEVEEWKTKHKQAKAEANSAQNVLQKEITTMRDANRTLTMKLRDIEVMNDDFERQARNTESSLEDLESKYNVAIERSVLLEGEMKAGEKEREDLRVETQRLRDELGDLKVESEITLEKLRLADETVERLRSRKPNSLAVETLRTRSPGSEASGMTPSSPTASTPPPRSDTMSEAPTPPSPPLSDTSAHVKPDPKTPSQTKVKTLAPQSATPRPSLYGPRTATRHTRGPSTASSISAATSDTKSMRPPVSRPRTTARPNNTTEPLPRSDSLYQIKQLRGRMQKIEERVHSARSKLPAPANTTPRGSPRNPRSPTGTNGNHIPSSVTVRRTSKRPSSSITTSSSLAETDESQQYSGTRRESLVKRLSYGGIPRPPSTTGSRTQTQPHIDRPASALDRPSRPSSRTSLARPPSRTAERSPSRTSGIGHGFSRPCSSISGSLHSSSSNTNGAAPTPTKTLHRLSASVSELRRLAEDSAISPLPLEKVVTGLPLPRRLSGRASLGKANGGAGAGEGNGNGEMRPPPGRVRKMSDVGETY